MADNWEYYMGTILDPNANPKAVIPYANQWGKTDRKKPTTRPAVTAPEEGSGTQYFNEPGVDYGYNALTGNYEPKVPGEPYTRVPGIDPAKVNLALIEAEMAASETAKTLKASDPLDTALEALIATPEPSEPVEIVVAGGGITPKKTPKQVSPKSEKNGVVNLPQPTGLLGLLGLAFPTKLKTGDSKGSKLNAKSDAEIQASVKALMATGNHNQKAAEAIAANKDSYTSSETGALMPTKSIAGKVRNTYGDE